jgi:DNA repair exonuclease SbcCD ATPase subunit
MELEKLFFSLGLDTKDMDKAWDEAMKKYGTKAKIKVSVDSKEVTKAANQTKIVKENNKQIVSNAQAQERIQREINATKNKELLLAEKIRTQEAKTNSIKQKSLSHIDNANKKIAQQGRLMQNLKTLAASYISIFAASRFVRELVTISGEFEMQRVSLQAILQDAEGANKIFEQIKNLAVKSPFQFKDIVSYTKQLSAFSIPMEKLYDTTKMLSDVSAGLGVGMDRLTLAYGQIRAASVLRGQEIRQLTEAGIPVMENLRKKFEELGEEGITIADVFDKVAARLVPFSMIEEMFQDMTAEGGKFYRMQEIQAATLKGQVSNLIDAYQIMLSEIGEGNNTVLKGGVKALRDMIDNYEEVGEKIMELVGIFGTYRVALTIANQLKAIHVIQTNAMAAGTARLTTTQILAEKAQKALNKSVLANPYVMAAAAVAALGYAIYKFTTYQTDAEKVQSRANEAHKEALAGYIKEELELKKMFDRLEKAKKGTKEYSDAKDVIQRKYGDYLKNLKDENGEIVKLADSYDLLSKKLKGVHMERAKTAFIGEAEREWAESMSDAITTTMDRIEKATVQGLLSTDAASELSIFMGELIRGEKQLSDMSDSVRKSYQVLLDVGGGLFGKDIKRVVADAAEANREYRQMMSASEKFFAVTGGEEVLGPPLPEKKNIQEWRKTIKEYVDSLDKFKESIAIRDGEAPEAYLGRLRDEYAKTADQIKVRSKLAGYDVSALQDRLEAIGGLFSALGVPIVETEEAASGGSTTKREEDPMVAILEARARMIQEVEKNYKSLLGSLSEGEAKEFLSQLYGDIDWLPINDLRGGLRGVIEDLRELGEEGVKSANKLQEALDKAENKEAVQAAIDKAEEWKKRREEINEIVEKNASVEEKIQALIKERDELLSNAMNEREEEAINTEYQSRIDALQREMYQLTNLYKKLFSDWNDMGAESLETLLQKTRQAQESAREITYGDGKTKMLVTVDGEDIEMTVRDYNALIKKLKELEDKTGENSPFKRLSEHIEGFDDALKEGGATFSDWVKQLSNKAQDALDYISPLGDSMVGLLESMGNEGAADAVQLGMDLAQTALDIGTALASGNYVQAATGIIKGITQVFAYHDKKMQRLIEASQRRIADLETAYDRLSRAMDRALGEDRYKYGSMQYRNLIAQTKEIEKQIKLEERKRKTDKEAVQSMRKELQDLRYQAQDIVIEMRNELLGGDMRSLAQQFGDTIFDAIMSGNDAALELKGTVDEMIQNIARNMLLQKLIEKPLDAIISKYSDSWIRPDGTFAGFDQVINSLPQMGNELMGFGENVIPIYEELMKALGWSDSTDGSQGGLGQAVRGVTEDTANLLGSYLNAIRADVSINKSTLSTISMNIGDINRQMSSAVGYLADVTQNTFRSANNSESILNKLNELTRANGATKLNVSVKTS